MAVQQKERLTNLLQLLTDLNYKRVELVRQHSTDQNLISCLKTQLADNGNWQQSNVTSTLPERFDLSFINEKGET
jgi:hypothetical protein